MDTMIRPPLTRELRSTDELKEAWFNSEPVIFGDPVLARTEIPFRQTFFPLGFPVAVAANVPEVLEAASKSWGRFNQLFKTETISITVGVTAGDPDAFPPAPLCRMRGHLTTCIADSDNFLVCDLSKRSAVIWVTDSTLRQEEYFRYFFLESAAMCMISNLYATAIHAGCVAMEGDGVLLCGDSGAGKSTLSYACGRAGWTYITDDASFLVHGEADNLIVGNCHQVRFRPAAQQFFPELDGIEVMRRAGGGKPSLEFFTGEQIKTAATVNAKHIVFLKRGVAEQELVSFPRAVARLVMEQRVYCMPFQTERQLAAIDRLLHRRVYELRYNDLDWAVNRLTQLARGGYE
jgi:hypothetical protein